MLDIRGDAAFLGDSIGCLYESKGVDPGICTERNYESDIGSLRSFNGTNPAVMGRMNIPHLKAGPLPGETAGSQSGKTSLMGSLRKGVGLIHELGELTGAEELPHNGGDRLWIHQVMGHHGINFLHAHAFLDRPLHTNQTDAVLILQEFAHSSDPPVAQMINIIHSSLGILEFHQSRSGDQDIFLSQGPHLNIGAYPQSMVHLQTAHI